MRGILIRGAVKSGAGMLEDTKFAIDRLTSLGITIEEVPYTDITVTAGQSEKNKIMIKGQWTDLPDFVLFSAFKARYSYEVSAIMRMFESMGVACINCYDVMEKANDKLYCFQVIKKALPEVKIPKTMLVTNDTTAAEIGDTIGFPVVIKILDGAMGKGVSLIKTEEELENLLNIVFAAEFGDQVLAQEAILYSKGRDLRLVVIGDKAVFAYMRSNEGKFRSNVKQGGSRIDYEASDELKSLAVKIAKAIGLKYGSVDFMFGKTEDEFYLCEVNAVPGLGAFSEAMKSGNTGLIDNMKNEMMKILKTP